MEKKSFKGRALRSGIILAAAAVMLLGNLTAYAAEDDEEPAGFFWQEDMVAGTVSEVGSDSITVRVSGAMGGAGFGMGMPDGQTPPELPDGERPEPPDGERPEGGMPQGEGPEFPDGEIPEGGMPQGEMPEPPEGEGPELPEGGFPDLPEGLDGMTGRPDGMPQGGFGMGMGTRSESEIVVNIDSNTVIVKGSGDESASLSDITAGSNVIVSLDGDTALTIAILN